MSESENARVGPPSSSTRTKASCARVGCNEHKRSWSLLNSFYAKVKEVLPKRICRCLKQPYLANPHNSNCIRYQGPVHCISQCKFMLSSKGLIRGMRWLLFTESMWGSNLSKRAPSTVPLYSCTRNISLRSQNITLAPVKGETINTENRAK